MWAIGPDREKIKRGLGKSKKQKYRFLWQQAGTKRVKYCMLNHLAEVICRYARHRNIEEWLKFCCDSKISIELLSRRKCACAPTILYRKSNKT